MGVTQEHSLPETRLLKTKKAGTAVQSGLVILLIQLNAIRSNRANKWAKNTSFFIHHLNILESLRVSK